MNIRYTRGLARFFAVVAALALAWPAPAVSGETQQAIERAATDARIFGTLETTYTLSPHLNPFAIDTDVEDGVVTLSGVVESDIDRDLAIEIARGVPGVREVRSELAVGEPGKRPPLPAPDGSRAFGQWVDDATTTAVVKTRLIANEHIAAKDIDVDTIDGVVTLRGTVRSAEEKALAEQMAANVDTVEVVRNELRIDAVARAAANAGAGG